MPNKDKNIPKRRFKEFENADAWELRKLGEVAEIVMGQSPDSKNYTDNPLDNILVQGNADLRDGCVVPRVWTTQVTKTAEKGDLILSVRAPVGDVGRTNYNVVLGRGVAGIKGNEFIYHLLVKMKLFGYWTKLSTGSTFESINSDDIKNSTILFPSHPEQEAIGTFFSTLDRQITLHQRKLDTLKEQKKTYLKLLFPSKGQTKPALRFQGFEDDWEEVKLGEVLSVSKLKNKENEYSKLNVLSVSREQGTVNQIEYQGRSFASDDVSGYKIVNVGQMIYTKSPLKGAPYGIFQTVTINGIVSPLYAVYNSSGRALASFVSLILKEDAIATHYLSPLVTKGAKNTINVTDEGALEGKVKIPTLPEQQAIGTFFQTLDREISQVEDKLASLKELKKTLLRKLFV